MAGPTPLQRLLMPERVAVVGSISRPDRMGSRTLTHLERAGFAGAIEAVSSVDDLSGEPLDAAVVAVPAVAVPGVLDRLAGLAHNAIVYSSGFAEAGDGRLEVPADLHVLGPNTVGCYWAPGRAVLTFANAFDDLVDCRTGRGVVVLSQSGAFGARVVSAARNRGLVVDGFLSTGNEDGYDLATLLHGLTAVSPTPTVIGVYLESLHDGAGFLHGVRSAVSAGIDVVCLIGGRSAAGADAAASHTAAASPDHRVLAEAIRRDGGIVVGSDRALIDTAIALVGNGPRTGRRAGRRIGIVTGSGGAGVVAADLAADAGASVPDLSAALQDRLAVRLPAYASARNPLDVTAQVIADTDLLAELIGELGTAGEVDGLLVIARAGQVAPLVGATRDVGLPVVVALLDGADATVAPLVDEGLPVLGDLHGAVVALASLGADPGDPASRRRPAADRSAEAADGLDLADDPIDGVASSLGAMEAVGIRVAPWRPVGTGPGRTDRIRDAVADLGLPVVVKADVEASIHKAAAGAVRLDITSVADALTAADELSALADRVVIARQLRGGPELFVGVRREATFGLVVAAGLGGGAMDLIDRVVTLPGDTSAEWLARRLLDAVFAGDRRWAPIADHLAATAVTLVDLVASTGAHLAECNPMIPCDGELVALDARYLRTGG